MKAQQIWHGDLVHCCFDGDQVRAFWVELRESDLYLFDRKTSSTPEMIVPLYPRYHLEDQSNQSIGDELALSIRVVSPRGQIVELIFMDRDKQQEWLSILKIVLGTFNFQDSYEALFKQNRGNIYSAQRKQTGERVMIYEIEKEDYKSSDDNQEDLLKAVIHPRINPLYDIHHSTTGDYAVYRECKGRSLASYLDSLNGQLLRSRVLIGLMSQLIQLLSFGKKLGIVFRNLSVASFSLEKEVIGSKDQIVPPLILSDLSKVRKVQWPFDESLLNEDIYGAGMVMLSLWEGRELTEMGAVCTPPHFIKSHSRTNLWKLIMKMVQEDPRKRVKLDGVKRVAALL